MSKKSKYLNSLVHIGLIEKDTDKAILIKIPNEKLHGDWFTWIPKHLLIDDEKNFYVFRYRNDWQFKLIERKYTTVPMAQWENIKETRAEEFKNIFEEYDTTALDDEVLIIQIEHHIDDLKRRIKHLNSTIKDIQEIEHLPKEIDSLILDTDLSELDVLVENMTLAKERYKHE